MKQKDPVKSQQEKDAEEKQGVAKRASLAIFMLVLIFLN